MKILIVDDSRFTQLTIAKLLKKSNRRCGNFFANDGGEEGGFKKNIRNSIQIMCLLIYLCLMLVDNS